MATLGEQLKATLDAIKAKEINQVQRENAKRQSKIERDRLGRKRLIEDLTTSIGSDIAHNKVPSIKVKNYDHQEWLRRVNGLGPRSVTRLLPDYDLWFEFISVMHDEGLNVRLVEDHDGVGMNSWINVIVVPI